MSASRSGLPSLSSTREHAVLARQRADRLLLPGREPVHHELGERAVRVRHAQRGVAGAGQRARGPDDHLQHVPHRELSVDREHRLAHLVENLVLSGTGRAPAARSAFTHPTLPAGGRRGIGHGS